MKSAASSRPRAAGPGRSTPVRQCCSTTEDRPLGWLDHSRLSHPKDWFGSHGIFASCRKYSERGLVRTLLQLKRGFFDFGFRLRPIESTPTARRELKDWTRENTEELVSFREALWSEFLSLDNAVVFWRDEPLSKHRALLLAPEACDYTDAMGLERLRYYHGLTPDQVKQLPAALRKRYERPDVVISEEFGEHFRVLKRAPVGRGWARPSLEGMFATLAGLESMEIGEELLGFACRLLVRQTLIGHEIKSGQWAGAPTHFWKQPRAASIMKDFKGKQGLMDLVTNFDQTTRFVRPEAAQFSADKWKSPLERIVWWAGPLGWMLTLKGVNQYLLTLFKHEALADREKVRPVLQDCLNAWGPPVPVEVIWSERCFADIRLATELLKHFSSQGVLSTTTGLAEAGWDLPQEQDFKREELAEFDREPRLFQPFYDAAHGPVAEGAGGRRTTQNRGSRSGAGQTSNPAGRPPGTPDPPEV